MTRSAIFLPLLNRWQLCWCALTHLWTCYFTCLCRLSVESWAAAGAGCEAAGQGSLDVDPPQSIEKEELLSGGFCDDAGVSLALVLADFLHYQPADANVAVEFACSSPSSLVLLVWSWSYAVCLYLCSGWPWECCQQPLLVEMCVACMNRKQRNGLSM